MEMSLSGRALTIFEDALDVEPYAREAWLVEACAGDAALLKDVKRLLAADELAERSMPTGGLKPDDAPMPARIGHYRIVDRLGQGGMGDTFVQRNVLRPCHQQTKGDSLRIAIGELRIIGLREEEPPPFGGKIGQALGAVF